MRKKTIRFVRLLTLSFLLIFIVSCGMIQAPVVPPYGNLYSNFTAPLELNSNGGKTLGTKKGEARSVAFFGLIAYGDAGIDKAVKDGNIQEVKHFDYHYKNYFFGAYATFTTIVYGN